jgi:uncharacterized membrane protein YccC
MTAGVSDATNMEGKGASKNSLSWGEDKRQHGNRGTERMQETKRGASLSPWDFFYAVDMAIACLITYWIMTSLLSRFVDKPNDLLGGMWAVVATVFVFRDSRVNALSSGIARLIATCVSFALCLLYLWLFPFTPVGLAVLI